MLDEMRAFVALAQEGSIRRAAQRVHLTQPAVTRQIQRLEQMLEVTLLDRRQRPPVLTPAGLRTVDRCRSILAAVHDLKAATSGAAPWGTLRVGIIHPLADAGLAPIVATLRELYPRVTLQIHGGWSHVLSEQVQRGVLDAAVVLSGPAGPDDTAQIAQDHFNVVASRTLKLASPLQLDDLDSYGWVLSPEPCTARAALSAALGARGKTLRIAAEVQDASLQLALVQQGLGLGFFPSRYGAQANAAGLDLFHVAEVSCPFTIRMERSATLQSLAPVVDRLQAELRARVLLSGDRRDARA